MCVSVLCGIRAVLARGAIRTHSGEVRIEAMVGSDAALLGVLSQWCVGLSTDDATFFLTFASRGARGKFLYVEIFA